MSKWRLLDNAILSVFNQNMDLTNTTADLYKVMLVYGGALSNNYVTVQDLINASLGESNNYTRQSLTNVVVTAGTGGKPLWSASNVNILVNGGTMHANIVGVYEDLGGGDSASNLVALGQLGGNPYVVTNAVTLELNLEDGVFEGDDPNNP
jgi:hypothetical protein